jgi:hypothetical protein
MGRNFHSAKVVAMCGNERVGVRFRTGKW